MLHFEHGVSILIEPQGGIIYSCVQLEPERSLPCSQRTAAQFRNRLVFCGEELLGHRPILMLEDHLLCIISLLLITCGHVHKFDRRRCVCVSYTSSPGFDSLPTDLTWPDWLTDWLKCSVRKYKSCHDYFVSCPSQCIIHNHLRIRCYTIYAVEKVSLLDWET
jgi:hypothetical protein